MAEKSIGMKKKSELTASIYKAIYENDDKDVMVSLIGLAVEDYTKFLSTNIHKEFGNLLEREFDGAHNFAYYRNENKESMSHKLE